MKRVMVQLDEDVLAELDGAAEAEGESRAGLVRRAIEGFLGERQRSRELREVVDSFERREQEDLTVPKPTVREAWPD